MDHHPAKVKIYSYITSLRHCFNSFFFFEMQYSFPWRRFCVIKFWSVRFSNSKFLLQSVHFTIFKSMFHEFKVGLSLSKKIFFFCFNDSPSKMRKNVFYFILKVLFVLKILKFLSWQSWHVQKTKLISKFMTSQPG